MTPTDVLKSLYLELSHVVPRDCISDREHRLRKLLFKTLPFFEQVRRDVAGIEQDILSEIEGKPTEFAAWTTVANTVRWSNELESEIRNTLEPSSI